MSSLISAQSLFNVKGIVAVVTGGGTGIGLMMAQALAANGAHKVYIIGRRKDKLDAAASSCPTQNIIPLPGDVSSQSSLRELAAHIQSDTGHVNVVIANSGTSGPSAPKVAPSASIIDLQTALSSIPMEDFTQCLHLNTTAVYYTAVAFLALLDAGNRKGNMPPGVRSQILATGSIAAYNRAVGAGWAYNPSKAATHQLVKMLATNLVPWGIRANALAPGLFPSEISAPLLEGKNATEEGAFDKTFIPAERTGDEQDMAGTILYLASRAGAYVNGSVLVVDGGRLSVLPSSY